MQLEYESLCDIAPNVWAIAKTRRSGTNAERDIFGSLRGFQLKSKAPDAVRPEDRTLTVYHRNAKRLEDAGQAAPYNVVLRPWTVGDQRVTGPATIDVARRL